MRGSQMAHLIRIGNSQGIRIPKPLIEQAQLEGKELTLQLVEGGLLISPDNNARVGWEAIIGKAIAAGGQEPVDREWLDVPLESDDDLEW